MMAQLWDSAIAEERNRMAGEIHDTLAQGFAGILFQLEAARDISAENPREAMPYIERAEGLARSSLAEARRSVWALRPPELESQGLVGAVQVFLNRITAGTATKISFSVRGKPYPLPNEESLGLFRICQEAIVNALRHARASEIQIELAYESSDVDLSVQDNGRGLDLQLSGKSEGFGLISMRERAERIGARFEVSGEPGRGTRLRVVAPSPVA
jgi:signal transduction histidine kinase